MNLKAMIEPKSIDDHYDQKLIDFVKNMVPNEKCHFFFWGGPGTGKTQFAHLLAKHILGDFFEMNFFEFNSSDDRGIDFIKSSVKDIAMSGSFAVNPKVILLDECDGLTHDAQSALRRIMEIGKAIFILTANYPNKLIPALKNRCSEWEFKGPSKEFLLKKTAHRSEFKSEFLEKVIDSSPPSFRDIFTNFEIAKSGGSLLKEENNLLSMTPKDFIERSWTLDPVVIISTLHREILNLKSQKKADLLICLADIDYRCSLNSLKILQIQSGFLKLFSILGKDK